MTIEEMKNQIIEKFGFEHPKTIEFFERCEKVKNFGDEYRLGVYFFTLRDRTLIED